MSSHGRQIGVDAQTEANRKLYEADEHEWIAQQIAALRSGRLHDLDCEDLVEFLEDSMSRDRRELRSRFSRLLQHLLKVKMQPEKMTRSWLLTIVHQQNEIRSLFRDIPSIRQHADRLFAEAYPDAVRQASAETGMAAASFPATSPWSIEEALAFTPQVPEGRASGRRKHAQGA